MAKFARSLTIFSFFACFMLFAALSPVHGRGSQDADLLKADELIDIREYDEATLLLSEFIRRNPERFELANQRLRRINQIRDQFNRIADELIYVLLEDPENSERILELTLQLRMLENEHSPLMVNFVARVHEIAQFNVYRNRLRRIMEAGREQIDSGDGERAIQTYAGGMDIMRDEFYLAGYGTRIEDTVREHTEKINSMLATYNQDSAQIRTLAAELAQAINLGQQARINDLVSRLLPAMDRFISLREDLNNSAEVLDGIMVEIRRARPDIGDRNHLAFLTRLINGRLEEPIQEGMLGAVDVSWRGTIGSYLIDGISSNIEQIYAASLEAFNRGEYRAVASSLAGNEDYINIAPLFFDKQRQFQESKNPPTVMLYDNLILQEDLPAYIKIVSLNEASNTLLAAANIAIQMNIDRSAYALWEQGGLSLDEALSREQQARGQYLDQQRQIELIRNHAVQRDNEISAYYDHVYIKNAISALEHMRSSLIAEEHQAIQRYYTIEYQFLESNVAQRREEMTRGRGFLDGETRTTIDGDSRVYRYPAEALEELTAMLAAINANIEHGNNVLTQFGNEPQVIISSPEFVDLRTRYQGLINDLNTMRTQGLALAETARSRVAQAEALRQEGERLFREAQSAYQRQNFEAARIAINRASERFTSSLEIQESASLRETWDNQLLELGRAIAIAENEIIIAEVRELVNDARNSYFSGDFQRAENNLVRARDRWSITNTEENEEVMYWLGMVRGGASARSGRVIPITAPLYPEMSQLLSQAQRNYEEGVRFINAGQRTDGLAKFDEARLQTREVKLVFPVNQEAGILELRMEQFIDPAAFNASFEQRIRTAINGTRSRSLEAYGDLQNLAEINPNYPGIRGILDQAEIDMGFRPPPPNPANIARSRDLTASANRILEQNLTAQFEVALAQINEAIILNPNNADAARVKDRLLSRMSVPGAVVLSSEDEEQYQRAVRELQAGNNLVALAIVDRLMQNPRNSNITKLIELQRRIQSVL